MLQILWDTRGYFFWLLVISASCWCLERLKPWRPQRAWRDQFAQDLFWLAFNGHYAGILLAALSAWALGKLAEALGQDFLAFLEPFRLLTNRALWLQFLVFLLAKDFLEYLIHNLLHRVPALWEFHKLHHSIRELDWIGNMRFHWMEIVVYRGLSYFPLFLLNVDSRVILWIAIFTTVIGHLNHSNLNLNWGILRYLLNSPRLHVWHHDLVSHQRSGQNFGVVFSLWDYLFGTVYAPAQGYPAKLGFDGMDQFPTGLISRLIYPLRLRVKSKQTIDAV
jgi:sterol desaturase/sphingolipid hydroxylase (fatty acid hydroxylase superfamily)